MPSERFLNLPEEKKKRIIKASLKEFSRVSYDEISINRIIQDAEIPRGSFYQYFEDKKDLQTFLLEGFRDCMESKIKIYLDEEKGDLFCFFKDALEEIVKVGMNEEYKGVCKNVFSHLKYAGPCNGEEIFAEDSRRLFAEIKEKIKETYYKNYSMEEITLIWEILFQLVKEAIVRIFLLEEPEDQVVEKYHKKIAIIEAGMKVKETKNA
ncbi:MAG: TetR/AcrR family transcriptional regulator [Lachnospiraceae bacterium]|nr:TetR/AcrR family transcriptional regulator [Lachnospiraceae bacterium]